MPKSQNGIREFNPVDGKFFLIERKDGELLAKTWDEASAKLVCAAPDLLDALKQLCAEIHLSKLNIKKDFSLINAHACALKAIYHAEGGK